MNSMAILQALIFEPKKAFAEIAERPRILFPLLVAILVSACVTVWYLRVVDMAWLVDNQLRGSGVARQLSEEQIAQAAKAAVENSGRNMIVAVVGNACGIALFYLLISVYNLLAGKITNVQRSFGQWFALACWAWLPAILLSTLVAVIALATASSAQISQDDLKSLSLNSLVFHKAAGEPGYSLLSYIGVPELLALWLGITGVREWSGRSWAFAAIFTLLPVALIVGVVAMIAMGRS